MKVYAKFLGVFVITTTSIFSQDFEIGLMFGLVSSVKAIEKPELPNEIQSIAVLTSGFGVLFDYYPQPHFALESGLLYGKRAYGYRYNFPGFSGDEIFSFHELEIPVVFRFFLADWFNVGFGGFYSKYTGEMSVIRKKGLSAVAPDVTGTYDEFYMEDSNYGTLVLLGFVYKSSETKLTFDINYRTGHQNVDKPNLYIRDPKAYIDHLDFYLGVKIPVGKPPADSSENLPVKPAEENHSI